LTPTKYLVAANHRRLVAINNNPRPHHDPIGAYDWPFSREREMRGALPAYTPIADDSRCHPESAAFWPRCAATRVPSSNSAIANGV
jgi:hypothetical protein